MNITEVLITGYDGESGVFAANVTRTRTRTLFPTDNADGQPVVDAVLDVTTAPATFDRLLDVLAELGVTAGVSRAGRRRG